MFGLTSVVEYYQYLMDQADPGTKDWFLISSIGYPIGLTVFMLVAIYFGDAIAQRWQYKNIARTVSQYNTFQLIANFSVGILLSWYIARAKYNLFCQPVRHKGPDIDTRSLWFWQRSNSQVSPQHQYEMDDAIYYEEKIVSLMWYYYVTKLIEVPDIFICLVNENLSFVLAYHHLSMAFATWAGVRFVPGGMTAIFAVLNCWVHGSVFLHYKLVNFGLVQRGGWTVNLVKAAAITQFAVIQILCLVGIFGPSCGYPIPVLVVTFLYTLVFIARHFTNMAGGSCGY